MQEWKKLGEAFSASLDQLAREQLDDRDPGSKRRRASLEKELEETKKLLAEKEKLIQDMAKEAAMKAKAEQGVLEAQARQRRSRK